MSKRFLGSPILHIYIYTYLPTYLPEDLVAALYTGDFLVVVSEMTSVGTWHRLPGKLKFRFFLV